MLDDKQREALFVDVHREIEVAAHRAAEAITGLRAVPDLAYPPNGGLTPQEANALRDHGADREAVSAIRKIIADAAAGPMFAFLSMLDGVADPSACGGPWGSFHIVAATEMEREHLMLHDVLFDTYWLWRDRRPDPGWRLDTFAD